MFYYTESNGGLRTSLVKLQLRFLSLQWKTCLWAELQPWCMSLQWRTCPWAVNLWQCVDCCGRPLCWTYVETRVSTYIMFCPNVRFYEWSNFYSVITSQFSAFFSTRQVQYTVCARTSVLFKLENIPLKCNW